MNGAAIKSISDARDGGNPVPPTAPMEGFRPRSVASAISSSQSKTRRFTIDGSQELEDSLESLCAIVCDGVQAIVPKAKLAGLILAGGYGRGEGGVLKTDSGDQPYNDLEFYIFVKGSALLGEAKYSGPLHELGHRLTATAGIEVEFKVLTLTKLRTAMPSMFFYDLVTRHRSLFGHLDLQAVGRHHCEPDAIPLAEATRLLMNRCSGLLFSAERLRRAEFGPEQADFVGRNFAKAQLALGDVLLTARGHYHWSCRERHRRLLSLQNFGDPAWHESLCWHHAAGVEFKLHPQRSRDSREVLGQRHAALRQMAQEAWLWLENMRLGTAFTTARDYALSTIDKCPETRAWRNRLINFKSFGPVAGLLESGVRHPRQRLLHALGLLLWHPDQLGDGPVLAALQRDLNTSAGDFPGLVSAYERLWHRFN